jgi:hypothetical protein
MQYLVSLVISIVVWKLVISPAVAEAVKALETAARVLSGPHLPQKPSQICTVNFFSNAL